MFRKALLIPGGVKALKQDAQGSRSNLFLSGVQEWVRQTTLRTNTFLSILDPASDDPLKCLSAMHFYN